MTVPIVYILSIINQYTDFTIAYITYIDTYSIIVNVSNFGETFRLHRFDALYITQNVLEVEENIIIKVSSNHERFHRELPTPNVPKIEENLNKIQVSLHLKGFPKGSMML